MPTAMHKFDPKATTAPRQACVFVREGSVTFAEGDDDNKQFSIVGYSGEIIPDHWFWDNLAFDLEGLKFAQKRTPVLDSHFTDRRLGFTTRQDIAESVSFEGQFLSNGHAQEFRQDMQEGFPMQASLYCPPNAIDRVREGESVEVNGRTLKGPGTVFRKATIREVSMCVFGADSNTSAAAFAEASTDNKVTFTVKESTMPQEQEHATAVPMTADRLRSEFTDVHGEILDTGKAEGARAELERFKTLQAACGDDTALLVECFADGKSEIDALKLRNERLASQLTEVSKQTASSEPQTPTDPAITEFKEQVPGKRFSDEGKPATFMEAVAKYQAEHGVKESEAVNKCVDLHPDLHAQMVNGGA